MPVSTLDDASPGSGEDGGSTYGALDFEQQDGPLGGHADLAAAGATSAQRKSDHGANNRAAVAVACIGCRSRHLKCDGGIRCSRCIAEGTECNYVKSRRGWKGPRRSARASNHTSNGLPSMAVSSQSALPQNGFSFPSNLDHFLPLPSTGLASTADTPLLLEPYNCIGGINQLMPAGIQTPPAIDSSTTGLLAAYYNYFHPAHPFLLPHNQILELLSTGQFSHLDLAIQYIGSLYLPPSKRGAQEDQLHEALFRDGVPKDGIMVQTMLLYSIGLHMTDFEEKSSSMMSETINLALELGMDKRDFAVRNGSNSTIMEESWRRTWWEIFVVDGMFAGVNPEYTLRLLNAQSNIDLPCEEMEYASGMIPPMLKNLSDYDDALFDDEDAVYSSSAYRIDAIRLLHKVFMASSGQASSSQLVDSADVHLTNWALHLPPEKRRPIGRDGKVDEVLFTAHMIISACTIMLHRPRSDLNLDEVEKVTTCVGAGSSIPLPGGFKDIHTAKAMQAAKDIGGLITLPCPMIKHTPFFSCAVTMSSIVFLSYWSFIATESGDAFIKDNIRLNIGVLKTLGEVWPIASTVLGQVKGVAKEIFQSRKALSNAYFHAVTREEIFQGIIESITPPGEDKELYDQFLALPHCN